MDIWIAVWLTQFIMTLIINAFTLVVFARSRHLRRRNTYLIMNLTVADLLIAAVSGRDCKSACFALGLFIATYDWKKL